MWTDNPHNNNRCSGSENQGIGRYKTMKTYRAELEDDNFEIILAENDNDALKQYWELEEQGHELFNLFELDENYDIVRTLC